MMDTSAGVMGCGGGMSRHVPAYWLKPVDQDAHWLPGTVPALPKDALIRRIKRPILTKHIKFAKYMLEISRDVIFSEKKKPLRERCTPSPRACKL